MATLGCLLCSWSCGDSSASERPNVLFISIDDLNDWLGCLGGHPQTRTPNLDRLAKRGVLFTNAHCTAPACNPSRAAVYTGLRPHRTGVWSNDSHKLPRRKGPAAGSNGSDHLYLPQAFQQSGYRTAGTGKLLHGGGSDQIFQEGFYPEQRWSPLTRQEAAYAPTELPSKGSDQPRHTVTRNASELDTRGALPPLVLPLNRMPSDRAPTKLKGESFDWGPIDVADGAMGDTKITNWSIKQLQRAESPFFLGVGYYRPHIPLWAPPKYFEPFSNVDIQLPPVLATDLDDLSSIGKTWATAPITAGAHGTVLRFKQWQEAVRGYLACVHYVDSEVGRLLDALDISPAASNTWIIVWSDHGWHLGEKQHWGKWTGWERSTRVPLMIVPPKRLSSEFACGETCDRPVNLIDLYPTLVELCGLPRKSQPLAGAIPELDGESLVPLLHDPNACAERVSVTWFDRGNVSVRLKDWRYIRYVDGSEELYDHVNDPNEWHNLLPERVSESALTK